MIFTLKHQIFIGYDSREHEAYEVCEKSIKDFFIEPRKLETRRIIEYKRDTGEPQSTDFTFSRFWLPFICNYQGLSLFVDCDFLFLKSPLEIIEEVGDKLTQKAVFVVKHPRYIPNSVKKMDDIEQNTYDRKNWSSLILFNNEHPKNRKLEPEYLNTHTPGLDFHQFKWLNDDDIGNLSLKWNVLDNYYYMLEEDIGAVHYTDGGPWFSDYENTMYSQLWKDKKRTIG